MAGSIAVLRALARGALVGAWLLAACRSQPPSPVSRGSHPASSQRPLRVEEPPTEVTHGPVDKSLLEVEIRDQRFVVPDDFAESLRDVRALLLDDAQALAIEFVLAIPDLEGGPFVIWTVDSELSAYTLGARLREVGFEDREVESKYSVVQLERGDTTARILSFPHSDHTVQTLIWRDSQGEAGHRHRVSRMLAFLPPEQVYELLTIVEPHIVTLNVSWREPERAPSAPTVVVSATKIEDATVRRLHEACRALGLVSKDLHQFGTGPSMYEHVYEGSVGDSVIGVNFQPEGEEGKVFIVARPWLPDEAEMRAEAEAASSAATP